MPLTVPASPDRRSHRGPLVVTLIVLAAVFIGVYLWRSVRTSAAPAYAQPPIEVAAVTLTPESLPQKIQAVGALQAVREVTLAAEAPGRITAISFEAGTAVATGALLVQLYDAPERADRAAAASKADFARLQLKRSQDLTASGVEARERLQQREAEVAQAQAAIAQLDARISQKRIRAPFSGRLGIRRVNLGQYVNAGDPIATLTALDKLYVNFTVPQQSLSQVQTGGLVQVASDAFPGRHFTARINAVEPVIGSETRNVTVQATLDNPGHILRPGMYVTAEVELPPRAGAIVVPATAIQTSASGDSAYVVRNGHAQPTPVITGQRVGERVVVEKGLAAGDVVITSGQLRVQPGAAVKISTSTPPAAKG